MKWCTLQISATQRLLVCSCGTTISCGPELQMCPSCGQIPEVRLVECADPYHNSDQGCQNPSCWKHHVMEKDPE